MYKTYSPCYFLAIFKLQLHLPSVVFLEIDGYLSKGNQRRQTRKFDVAEASCNYGFFF